MKTLSFRIAWMLALVVSALAAWPAAQGQPGSEPSATLPPGYVIGPEDLLSILFVDEKDMSADVVVRPDGKITLPLLNDVDAVGQTPEQLGVTLAQAATKFLKAAPTVTVTVKEIRSRKVYILGEVAKPGTYPLNVDMNVLQLLATAGGLLEWADKDRIQVARTENGKETRYRFNYNDVLKGKNPSQNIPLKPGDMVVVP
jgi:polysaccharide biosynthesis/export protein